MAPFLKTKNEGYNISCT